MKRGIIFLLTGILLLLFFLLPIFFSSPPPTYPSLPSFPLPEESLNRFSMALRIPTISYQEKEKIQKENFLLFIQFLSQHYPLLHKVLKQEVVGGYSLLYLWEGEDPSLPPLLLMGHYDVVPVEIETLSQWVYPPFSGTITEGYIWGRGSLDDKISVIGILEAVESLLKEGFSPKRPLYISFGHDEEIGGKEGAKRVAELLTERGIKPLLVVDEGLPILSDFLPGMTRPVALIGAQEKGYMTIEIRAKGPGGHSSAPPLRPAPIVLSEALRIVDRLPFPERIPEVVEEGFLSLQSELPFFTRLLLHHLWLFKPLFLSRLKKQPQTRGLIQTTCVPTILRGGTKENIVPQVVSAIVNCRILPGDTGEKILSLIRNRLKDLPVEVEPIQDGILSDPSPDPPIQSEIFLRLKKIAGGVGGENLVTPFLLLGATDSRHFSPLTPQIYRFTPVLLSREDLPRIHGVNERISIKGFASAVAFYREVIREFGGR